MAKKCLNITFGRCYVSSYRNLGHRDIIQSIFPALRQVQGYFAGPSRMYLQFPFTPPERQISQCFLLTSERAKKLFLLASL